MGAWNRRIVIVANRGPNDFAWQDGRWVVRPAAGGLVSMLEPLARRPNVRWFCCVSEPPDAQEAREGLYTTAADEADPDLHVVPIPLPARLYQAYYGQISNEVLWMLQHGLVGADGLAAIDARRHRAWEEGYQEANRRLANTLAGATPAPDAFLVQDYHLYPLPALLRRRFPRTPILHFTHIPFPDPPALKLLPEAWRRAILAGLLGADVVGLQTPGDVRAFLAGCADILGAAVEERAGLVRAADGRTVRVRAYPASVDPAALAQVTLTPAVAAARARLAAPAGARTIIRVDRLDPSKGQIEGFRAFERLLELRPDLRGRLRFLAFLVPSRTDLAIYRAHRDAVYAQVERVNARFTPDDGQPPIEVYYTNDREQALAAMIDCDALLVNSRRDGMNLVAKEWAIVSRRPGALIVSETAGAADAMAGGALPVAPLDVEGTARALARALDLPAAARAARLAVMRESVLRWTADDWLGEQLAALGLDAAHPDLVSAGPALTLPPPAAATPALADA
jgi:trehalose 6-phosphate synthase